MNAGQGQPMDSQCTEHQRPMNELRRNSVVHFLCRCDARKYVGGASRLLVGAVLVVGCNFTDFSKTSTSQVDAGADAGIATEPACLKPTIVSDAGVSAVAHWTFNGAVDNGQWLLDELNIHRLVAGADDSAKAGVAAPAAYPRINGEGQSLMLDGHQFARSEGPAESDLLPEQFTLAAWVSVPARAFTSDGPSSLAWPILSTLNDANCNGYQLEIQFQKSTAQVELVLSRQAQTPSDGGANECTILSLHAPIDVPSWATGIGRWHHVAGTLARVGNGRTQLALYWDGKRVQLQDPLETLLSIPSDLNGDERALYIGASALNEPTVAQTKFNGFIDDIAIFNQPLSEQELADFVLASTTRPGPSNCRWRASEQWDTTATSASYTTWSIGSSPDALTVDIEDQDWGAGVLDARLVPPRDLQLYDTAILDAIVPNGQAFQFTLASGDNYCTWVYLGQGPNNTKYSVDLARPVNCVSSTCEVDFHRIDRASVTSEWAVPYDAGEVRLRGPQSFTVRHLDFSAAAGVLPDWSAYGGVLGPLGYCWRLQAYEPGTNAQWNQRTTAWDDSVSAILTGPNISGTRLMADFGERPIDLSNCKSVVVDAKLLGKLSSGSFAFVIQDVYGDWRSYNLIQDPTLQTYNVSDLNAPISSSDIGQRTSNFELFQKYLEPSKVRLLGIQKPWNNDGVYTVTLRSLQFFDANGLPNCERPGVN